MYVAAVRDEEVAAARGREKKTNKQVQSASVQ
jgi:hypothetical protein